MGRVVLPPASPANAAVDEMRCIELRTDMALEGMRWSLLKDRSNLNHLQAE